MIVRRAVKNADHALLEVRKLLASYDIHRVKVIHRGQQSIADKVIYAICDNYGITHDEMMSKDKTWRVLWPRIMAAGFIHKLSNPPPCDRAMGAFFCRSRDWATWVRPKFNELASNPECKSEVNFMLKRLSDSDK